MREAKGSLPGLDFIALQFMWGMESGSANNVSKHKFTPTDGQLRETIRFITQELQLKVLLKPLVVAGAVQMPFLNPSNLSEWFNSYNELMNQTALLAQEEGVWMLSVGLELQQIATPESNQHFWHQTIASSRELCPSCQLTYCSNPISNETAQVPFWRLLDAIGADYYAPFIVSREPSAAKVLPSRAAMFATYDYILNKKLLSWYAAESKRSPLPHILITESGFPSSNAGLQSPWLMAETCTGYNASNMTAQATAYEVAFEVLTSTPQVSSVFSGFTQFWFGEPGTKDYVADKAHPDSTWGCGWTPVGKNDTMSVLRKAFSRN